MAKKNKYSFDSKIHVYRATKRMSQQELADLVGVSRQTIIQLERNRYNPSMLLAYSIAKVFDVTIEDLFDTPPARIRAIMASSISPTFEKSRSRTFP